MHINDDYNHTLVMGENGGAFGDEEFSMVATSFTATSFGGGEGIGNEEISTAKKYPPYHFYYK